MRTTQLYIFDSQHRQEPEVEVGLLFMKSADT